LALFGR
jgi:hypothetical protein